MWQASGGVKGGPTNPNEINSRTKDEDTKSRHQTSRRPHLPLLTCFTPIGPPSPRLLGSTSRGNKCQPTPGWNCDGFLADGFPSQLIGGVAYSFNASPSLSLRFSSPPSRFALFCIGSGRIGGGVGRGGYGIPQPPVSRADDAAVRGAAAAAAEGR
ncbi:hypothetical protein B296_00016765 [Ensete ventricosum]|uniref:Uncharacterized protein n=1 Tax=Ensete ventricosum TaxID=4639 RepID=A0A426YF60_ENSVE|nr:hypothetical protein B296_00016765 [Ensete ventricosum]